MANRSDFFNAKIPRSVKKTISLGELSGAYDKASAGQARKIFADAHASHVAFKLRRNTIDNKDSGE